jgi:hypothetical protein
MSRSKRIKRIAIHLTPEELQLAEAMAKNLQVSISGYFDTTLLNNNINQLCAKN